MNTLQRLDLLADWYRAAARHYVAPTEAPSEEHHRYRIMRSAEHRLRNAGDLLKVGTVGALYCEELADRYEDDLIRFALSDVMEHTLR